MRLTYLLIPLAFFSSAASANNCEVTVSAGDSMRYDTRSMSMAFAYFLVFPVVFGFISSTAPDGVAMMTDISKYLDFAISLFIAFGLAFETPIAVILMVSAGMVSISALRQARSYVIVGAFVLGAILTPPDIISQFMLAIPIWMLYEAGILVASMMYRQVEQTES